MPLQAGPETSCRCLAPCEAADERTPRQAPDGKRRFSKVSFGKVSYIEDHVSAETLAVLWQWQAPIGHDEDEGCSIASALARFQTNKLRRGVSARMNKDVTLASPTMSKLLRRRSSQTDWVPVDDDDSPSCSRSAKCTVGWEA